MHKAPGRWQLTTALKALYQGKTIAYPTEAVWGLGCDPFNQQAVYRLLNTKNRPPEKGLILVAANADQIAPLLAPLSESQKNQLTQLAPNGRATTWLIPHYDSIPRWVTGEHDTVAVRISRHPVVHALCLAFGGMIVSTSANPASFRPALNQLQARCYFGRRIGAYVPGAVGKDAMPSQIRHLLTGEVLR